MASEAQIKQKRLDEELAKPYPDNDIVYALKTTRPYWNTIDTAKVSRGLEKLNNTSLQKALNELTAPTTNQIREER